MKKLISRVLVLAMVVALFQTSAYAAANNTSVCDQVNQQISDTGIAFSYISDTKLVYTYEKDGETYKYVESISSNTVKSEVYLLVDGDYEYVDTIVTVIDIPTATAISRTDRLTDHTVSPAAYEYNWQLISVSEGDTALNGQNYSDIATILAAVAGAAGLGGVSAFFAIASIIVKNNLKTVYYTIYTYKDLNNPSTLRPTYKYVIHYYSDSARTKELEKSPVTRIVDGG